MERSPEIVRPIVMPGEPVLEGDPAMLYDQPLSPEDEAEFEAALKSIQEAERRAWIEGHRVHIR